MKSIGTKIKLPMCIGTCIPLLTTYSKKDKYIERMDNKIESSASEKPKEVLKLDWIKENTDVECDEHLKNINDIGFQ